MIGTPLRVFLIDARATAYNARLPIRVPRLEILFWLPLNFPDSLTELSIPKKATRCLGLIKPLISPISATKVIAVNSPIPGIDFKSSILVLTCYGKLVDLIKLLISFIKLLVSASRVFIIDKLLAILKDRPDKGKPITAASLATIYNLE